MRLVNQGYTPLRAARELNQSNAHRGTAMSAGRFPSEVTRDAAKDRPSCSLIMNSYSYSMSRMLMSEAAPSIRPIPANEKRLYCVSCERLAVSGSSALPYRRFAPGEENARRREERSQAGYNHPLLQLRKHCCHG